VGYVAGFDSSKGSCEARARQHDFMNGASQLYRDSASAETAHLSAGSALAALRTAAAKSDAAQQHATAHLNPNVCSALEPRCQEALTGAIAAALLLPQPIQQVRLHSKHPQQRRHSDIAPTTPHAWGFVAP
jgi:hypothetical protein